MKRSNSWETKEARMWKAIYKVLLVSVLSGSLLMVDFSFKSSQISIQFNTTQAETLKLEGAKDGDIMSTLTMTAIGLLTQRLWTCKLSTDMMIAAAGGAAFIAGEILATLKLRKAMKDLEQEIKRNDNGSLDNKQIETLQKLRKSYEEAKNTANTKKMLQTAAAAAFAAAAVAAYMLDAQEKAAFMACRTAIAAASACPGIANSPAMAALEKLNALRLIPAPSMVAETSSIEGQATSTATQTTAVASGAQLTGKYTATCAKPYCAGCWACPLISPCTSLPPQINTACAPLTPLLKTTDGFCPAPLSFGKAKNPTDKYFAKTNLRPSGLYLMLLAKRLLMQDARADLFSPLGIASSAAISFLLMTNKALGATIDSYLLAPINRAVIWGVLAGLTYAATSSTSNQIGIIEGNIAKIDAILNSLQSLSKGIDQSTNSVKNPQINAVSVKNDNLAVVNGSLTNDIDLKAMGATLPCQTGDGSKTCKSFGSDIKTGTGNLQGLSDIAKAQMGNIASMSDGLNNTSNISSGTLNSAQALASQANALNAEMIKRRTEAQAKLKASGSKINLTKQASDFETSLKDIIQKQLEKQKMSAREMYANFGAPSDLGKSMNIGGSGKDGLNGSSKDAIDKSANSAVGSAGAGGALPVIAIPADLANEKLKDDSLTDEEKEAKELAEKLAAEEAAKKAMEETKNAAATIDDYNLEGQINKDSEKSIFDQISNRYQKSGYPRLFRRIK